MLLDQYEKREKVKVVFSAIAIVLVVIVLLWGCLFGVDYMMLQILNQLCLLIQE